MLAPMAGVTDRPFRQLCRRLGAGLATSEMVTADPRLRSSRKTRLRMDHQGEAGPISVQIAGYDPQMMADAARFNVDHGADIIDINMGCPAKKVCNVAAGSALLRDEALVADILTAVVKAVAVPVTLKIRTGWCHATRNGLTIARIAEDAGVQALAVHGRTRADGYTGEVEYETVRSIKRAVSIPVIANGDIVDASSARRVMNETRADALMIGRAAQGCPWIFQEVAAAMADEALPAKPDPAQIGQWLSEHLHALYGFYGDENGIRVARKHIAWYAQGHPGAADLRQAVNTATTASKQAALVDHYFKRLIDEDRLAA